MGKEYDLVAYSNDFATSIAKYSAYELDLILCLVFTARQAIDNRNVPLDKDLELELNSTEVRRNINGNVTVKRMKEAMLNIYDTKVFFSDEKYDRANHLFEELAFSKDYNTIKFVLKKKHIKLFFNLFESFTQHSIKEITSLNGIYAKKIYQLMYSFKDIGHIKLKAEEFKRMLEIPSGYKWGTIDIRIFKASKEQIENKTDFIIDFEKIKIGNKITAINIKWHRKEKLITENPFADKKIIKPKKDLKAKPEPLTEEQEKEFERLVTEKKVVKPVGLRKGTDIYIKTVKGILENYKKQEGEDEQK